tara:strand:- start:854 stop:1525 length:672 start_codon:yes stop_codon:yes gene_type:complete
MNKLGNFLRDIEKKTNSKDSTHYFPRGKWHHKDTLLNDETDTHHYKPAELLDCHLPEGGTILEIYSGCCDITYKVSQLKEYNFGKNGSPKWEIHATDIQATDFLTAKRSIDSGINLYDISINDLIQYDLPEKVDVLMCRHTFGRNDEHFHGGGSGELEQVIKTNAETEQWMYRNFRYYVADIGVPGVRAMERYRQQLNMYDDNTNNVELIGNVGEFYLVKLNS